LRRLHQHRNGDWRKQNEGGGEASDLGHLLFPENVMFDDQEMPPHACWMRDWQKSRVQDPYAKVVRRATLRRAQGGAIVDAGGRAPA